MEARTIMKTAEMKGFARLRIHPGKLQEFKHLQAQCMAVVRAKDTGTLQYEAFFNDDSSECIIYERYRDSEALLEHITNLGALMTAIFQVCSASGEILGTPSAQLRKALEGSPVAIYTLYESL
jgi:quinol monooxygenase YgiN